ncbi:hypothetical protein [Acidiphilium iwatense]|uniref:Uncharacterized protein n=1 Tax=Acidiphilium iwatense TaxID=768198 RepID=A0ABS9DY90_9PROT|nr:hypothetical protein [Acidiphilium iwatense]MCF3946289.1 hypothetical protein [Acidiphilium iwatense]
MIRRFLADFFHQGILYWARVAMFDVTLDPLLPREGRDLRHAVARKRESRIASRDSD